MHNRLTMAACLPDVIDEEILCCPLCLRPLQRPKVLPCLHLFCTTCLEDYVRSHSAKPPSAHGTHHDYLTFPDTPRNDIKDNPLSSHNSSKRSSTASNDSFKKRFQQPERYTDRDSMVQRAELYRNQYRMSKTKFKQKPNEGQNDLGKESNKIKETSPTSNAVTSKAARPDSIEIKDSKSTKKSKVFSRALSSPQRLLKSPSEERELQSRAGQVTNMVNLFERRMSTSSSSAPSSRDTTPPLATFRTKEKSQEKDTFIPLNQRPVPKVQNGTAPKMLRSRSAGVLPMTSSTSSSTSSVFPKVSLSTQDSFDSAIGTGESDKQLVFVDACPPQRQCSKSSLARIPSMSEENFYESYEIPNTTTTKGMKGSASALGLAREPKYSNVNVYELAKSTGTMRGQETLASRGTKESIKRIKSNHSGSDSRKVQSRVESFSENIYHDIPDIQPSRMRSKRLSGSVPDLLAEVLDDDIPTEPPPPPPQQKMVRRNSTILDSYVMASDLTSMDRKNSPDDLNQKIPLSNEDSQRLSNMYMRMDGGRPKIASQVSYVAMNGLQSPSTAFPVESVQTIIRSISEDFQNRNSKLGLPSGKTPMDDNVFSFDSPPPPLKHEDPPIYENSPPKKLEKQETVDDLDIDIDLPIPIYESTDIKGGSDSYYNMKSQKKTDAKQDEPDVAQPPKNKDSQFPCPTCERQFTLTNGQVSSLQDCSFASQMKEVVQTQKCEKKQCGHCENKVALYKCLDCEIYLCPGCHRGHSWSRMNKEHKVVTLQELQSGKYQQEIKQLQVTKCDVAQCPGNEAKHFCANCDKLLCSDCLVGHSRFHQSCPLEYAASREQDFIQSMTDSLQSRKEIFNGATNNLTTYQSHCRDARDVVLEELKAHQEYVHLVLDQCFDFIRSKVRTDFDMEISKAERLKTDVQQNLSSIDHATKFVKQLTEHGNPGNMVAMATTLKREISRLQSETPKVMESQMRMSYFPGDVSVQQLQQLCGEVTADYVQLPEITKKESFNTHELTERHTHQMELVMQFMTKLENDRKGCRPNGVTITPDNLIVIVDDINKKLKAFDFQGSRQWEICPQGQNALHDPWDVVALGDGKFAVTDKGSNNVKVYTKTGAFVTSFGDHLKKPWGIATNSKGDIVVTDAELRKVFVHDVSGRLLYTLPSQASATPSTSDLQDTLTNFTFKCPEYVACSPFNDIIVSDFENHRILVFDSLGRPLFKFGKKGKGMDEFHYPLGVSTDANGNIFVVNYQNQRITVVTRNGQFLCCLTSKVALQSLQTISLSSSGHLVVIDGSRVKIFKLPRSVVDAGVCPNAPENVPRKRVLVLKSESGEPSNRPSSSKETDV